MLEALALEWARFLAGWAVGGGYFMVVAAAILVPALVGTVWGELHRRRQLGDPDRG